MADNVDNADSKEMLMRLKLDFSKANQQIEELSAKLDKLVQSKNNMGGKSGFNKEAIEKYEHELTLVHDQYKAIASEIANIKNLNEQAFNDIAKTSEGQAKKAKEEIQTYARQIRNLQSAIEKGDQTSNKIVSYNGKKLSMADASNLKANIEERKRLIDELVGFRSKFQKMTSEDFGKGLFKNVDKMTNANLNGLQARQRKISSFLDNTNKLFQKLKSQASESTQELFDDMKSTLGLYDMELKNRINAFTAYQEKQKQIKEAEKEEVKRLKALEQEQKLLKESGLTSGDPSKFTSSGISYLQKQLNMTSDKIRNINKEIKEASDSGKKATKEQLTNLRKLEEQQTTLTNTLKSYQAYQSHTKFQGLKETDEIKRLLSKDVNELTKGNINTLNDRIQLINKNLRNYRKMLNDGSIQKGSEAEKHITSYLKEQEAYQTKITERLKESQLYQSKLSNAKALTQPYISINKELNECNLRAEQLWRTMKTASGEARVNARNMLNAEKARIEELRNNLDSYNKFVGNVQRSNGVLGSFAQKFRSHTNWIITGAIIGTTIAVPLETVRSWERLEQAMAGVKQVLNKDGQNLEHNPALANKEMMNFIGIAQQYGEEVFKVIEAGRSWGRMYKDIDTVNMLVSQSAKMATADNFDLAESVSGLESAMAQFGLKSQDYNTILQNSNRILDVWTILSHQAGVKAQDLTQAVERAGSSAHKSGVSFEFFNALVATGVRDTARSGAEIGQTLKTIFSSIHSDKAVKALQEYGIQVYKTNKEGQREYRNTEDVLLDVARVTQTTTKNTEQLMLALSGGKWQVSKGQSIFGDYEEILDNLEKTYHSAGFTTEQVGIQLDTLARKVTSLHDALMGLVAENGVHGMGESLKEITGSLTDFVNGLSKVGGSLMTVGASATAGYLGLKMFVGTLKIAGQVQALANYDQVIASTLTSENTIATEQNTNAKLVNSQATNTETISEAESIATKGASVISTERQNLAELENSNVKKANTTATIANNLVGKESTATAMMNTLAIVRTSRAKTAEKIATQELTQAQVALNIVEQNWITLAMMAGTAIYFYLTSVGKAKDGVDKLKEAQLKNQETMNALHQQITDMQGNIDLVDTLCRQYDKLSDTLSKTSKGSTEYARAEKLLGIVKEHLSSILHKDTSVFIKDGKLRMDIIHQLTGTVKQEMETKVKCEKAKVEAGKLALKAQIKIAKTRIALLEKEASAVKATLSVWSSWYFVASKYHKWQMDNAMDDMKAHENDMDRTAYNEAKAKYDEYSKKYAEDLAHTGDEKLIKQRIDSEKAQLNQLEQEASQYNAQSAEFDKALAEINGARQEVSTGTVVGGDKEQKQAQKHANSLINKNNNALNKLNKSIDSLNVSIVDGKEREIDRDKKNQLDDIEYQNKHYGVTDGTIRIENFILDNTAKRYENLAKEVQLQVAKQTKDINEVAKKPVVTLSSPISDIDAFMKATAMIETGGETDPYHTRNSIGAYGKYQFMPSTWRGYSRKYFGQDLDITSPQNQEMVARKAMMDIYNRTGDWGKVAYAWNHSQSYVNQVLGQMRRFKGEQNVQVANLSKYISPTDWSKLDEQGKLDFINAHGNDLQGANAIVNKVQTVLKLKKKYDELIDKARNTKRERDEKYFANVNQLIGGMKEEAQFAIDDQKAHLGINAKQSVLDQTMIKKNTEILSKMRKYLEAIKDTSSKEYKKFKDDYNKLLLEQQKLEYETSISDKYEEDNKDLDLDSRINEASHSDTDSIFKTQQYLSRRLDIATKRYLVAKEEFEKAMKNKLVDPEFYKQAEANLREAEKNLKSIQEEYGNQIRQGEHDILHSLIIEGNSFRDVWKRLWVGLAEDALKALMGIGNQAPSFLGRLLGIGRAFGGASATKYIIGGGSSPMDYVIGGGLRLFANGGVFDEPSIVGEDGEEVAIPVEKNTHNSVALLNYASRRLGLQSTKVIPNVNQKTSSTARQIAQSHEQLLKMDKQIELLAQQNTILTFLANNMGKQNGGNTAVIVGGGAGSHISPEGFAQLFHEAKNRRLI